MKAIVMLTYAVLGTYQLDVQIGEHQFTDILTLSEINEEGSVSGTFEVPRVFKVPFEGKLIEDNLKGEFLAKERGTTFQVILEAKIISKCSLKGELIQKGIPFGSFLGTKEGCHE